MEEYILETLFNKQLEEHGKTYREVVKDPSWFTKYKTTEKKQSEFADWAALYLMQELKCSRYLAETEVSWFLLENGLWIEGAEEKEERIN